MRGISAVLLMSSCWSAAVLLVLTGWVCILVAFRHVCSPAIVVGFCTYVDQCLALLDAVCTMLHTLQDLWGVGTVLSFIDDAKLARAASSVRSHGFGTHQTAESSCIRDRSCRCMLFISLFGFLVGVYLCWRLAQPTTALVLHACALSRLCNGSHYHCYAAVLSTGIK